MMVVEAREVAAQVVATVLAEGAAAASRGVMVAGERAAVKGAVARVAVGRREGMVGRAAERAVGVMAGSVGLAGSVGSAGSAEAAAAGGSVACWVAEAARVGLSAATEAAAAQGEAIWAVAPGEVEEERVGLMVVRAAARVEDSMAVGTEEKAEPTVAREQAEGSRQAAENQASQMASSGSWSTHICASNPLGRVDVPFGHRRAARR